ncbi:MAG: hypothetical protein ACWGNK_14125 [Desulfobacterales bacterium]
MANNFRVDVIGGDMKRLNVNTFGSDIFRANIAEMSKRAITIDYTGRFKEALTEE